MTDLTATAIRALKLMDLTTLNDDDTDEKVIALCHQAKSPAGNTAAICIYPRFIPIARKTLREQVRQIFASRPLPTSRTAMTMWTSRWQKLMPPSLTAQTKWMWCSLPCADRQE